jgi:AraC-like DNA-binding protein
LNKPRHNETRFLLPGDFGRPTYGPTYSGRHRDLPLSGKIGWRSNGGSERGDPYRTFPYTLDVRVPTEEGALVRAHLVGVFALNAAREQEAAGTLGACLIFGDPQRPQARVDLINGRHYSDARRMDPIDRLVGDGAGVETIGEIELEGLPARVDVLTVELPASSRPKTLRFKDLGSPASFVLFDVIFELEAPRGCPFSSRGSGIPLSELSSIIRMGDRARLLQALSQLEAGLLTAPDLDEAKGQALTFIAMITAATIELGGSRQMHRVQLDAARALDRLTSLSKVASETRLIVESLATPDCDPATSPSLRLIDRALTYLQRHYAKEVSDEVLARELGLSTSHFRHLFREVTGQPFYKYLNSLRLEQARRLLIEADLPVSEVAAAVGFSGLAQFSRAFSQRFSVSPSALRKTTASASRRA